MRDRISDCPGFIDVAKDFPLHQRSAVRLGLGGLLLGILCTMCVGCATSWVADPLDWTSMSDQNESASMLARRHNALGIKWMGRGKLAKAEHHFHKAIDISPRYAAPKNNLGNLHFARQELYLAAWEFERAAELEPNSPEPIINLGLVYEQAGHLELAEQQYRRALDLMPNLPSAVGNLTRILIKTDGDPQEIGQLLHHLMLVESRPEWRDWADRLLSESYRHQSLMDPAFYPIPEPILPEPILMESIPETPLPENQNDLLPPPGTEILETPQESWPTEPPAPQTPWTNPPQ